MFFLLAFQLVGTGCRSVPLQVGVFDPVQLVNRERDVAGLKLNLPYGRNHEVRGVDLGVVGVVDETLIGLQANVLGSSAAEVRGVQTSWPTLSPVALNMAGRVQGLQSGLDVFGTVQVALDVSGMQLALSCLVNSNEGYSLRGTQVGVAFLCSRNEMSESVDGLQLAGIIGLNETARLRGVQIATCNIAKDVTNTQLGVVNISSRHTCPFIPILNARF